MSKGKYGHDGLTQTYTDPADGTVYIWDREKNAWFPKVNYIINICFKLFSVTYCLARLCDISGKKFSNYLIIKLYVLLCKSMYITQM